MNNLATKCISRLLFFTFFLFFISIDCAISQDDGIELRVSVIRVCQFVNPDVFNHSSTECSQESLLGLIKDDSSNEVEVNIAAYAVNIPGIEDENNNSFPDEYPKPFLRYKYGPGEFMFTDELIDWKIVDEMKASDGSTDYLYQATKTVNIQLPDDVECNEETGTMNFQLDLRLFSYSSQNDDWQDYPIMDYSDKGNLFSCDHFHETKHLCHPDMEAKFAHSVEICIPCNDEPENLSSSEINKDNVLRILSNPFSEMLEYKLISKRESKFNVSLHSYDGSLVFNKDISTSIGANNLQISDINFNKGIYYLSFVGEGTKSVHKILCIK